MAGYLVNFIHADLQVFYVNLAENLDVAKSFSIKLVLIFF